jgi:competence protein ComEA
VPFLTVSRSTTLVGVSLLLALLVVLGSRIARTGTARAPEAVASLEPVAKPRARPALVVHVVGAVRHPGLYRLPDGSRVADAVARAGGAARNAELAALNLAAPLVDGIQVLVPRRVETGAPATAGSGGTGTGVTGGGAATPAVRVSLSSATADELDALPGVGPVTAQKIIDYRAEHGPFGSVDDLDAVPGIGPARIEQLRDLVTP